MKLIHTADDRYYRRWVNLIASSLFPGSAQFLSGRKVAGIAYFLFYVLVVSLWLGILVHPNIPYSVVQPGPLDWFLLPFWLFIAGDGLRRPMPCLGFRGWALFLVISLGVPILLALAVRAFIVQTFKVPTGGMSPTIMGIRTDAEGHRILGDHMFVNKLIYLVSEPRRGDVIVFRTKGIMSLKQDAIYIQRLVGLPGETIRIDDPYVYVNGSRLLSPPIFRAIAEGNNGFRGYHLAYSNSVVTACLSSPSSEITLGPGEFFVMGDNSNNSLDGRYFGPIKRNAIMGKAFYIYAPAERKHWIE